MRALHDKSALITGAASGIGRAIAVRLAGEGTRLYLVDIDAPGLSACADACRATGVDVLTRSCDITDRTAITGVVDDVLDRWNGVDLLVNNAGIVYHGHMHEMTDAHWDRVIDTNLHSHIYLTRKLLPSLLDRPEAHVLNMCSILGLVGMPRVNAYCVSKFGLVGFSEALRAEYGREGLGVTAVCPGFVDTKLFTNAPLAESAKEHKAPPKWLRASPDTIAAASIRAIRRDKRLVLAAPGARGFNLLKRYSPGLLDFALRLGRRKRIRQKRLALQGRPSSPELRSSDSAQSNAA